MEWVDRVGRASVPGLEDLLDELSDALAAPRAFVFHGSRVDDPGRFSREGLKVNDPAALDEHVRELIRSEPELAAVYPDADALLATFPKRERDAGRLYVVLDSRSLTAGGAGHHLVYGSEWVQVILGWVAHPVLRARGYPTLVRAVLSLYRASDSERRELARHLVLERARLAAMRDGWVQDIDFTFTLVEDLPPGAVLGHTHPAIIEDPFHRVRRRTELPKCPACDP